MSEILIYFFEIIFSRWYYRYKKMDMCIWKWENDFLKREAKLIKKNKKIF